VSAFSRRNLPGILVGLVVTALCLALRVLDLPVVSTLRGAGFDTLQSLWPRSNKTPQPVRIVDIDEASLKVLGQWPWPRNEVAKLVDELSAMGAAAIVFDIVFPEPDRASSINDTVLVEAITGNPVVVAFATSPGKLTHVPQQKAGFAQTGNSALLAPPRLTKLTQNWGDIDNAAAGLGSININLAIDQGVARQIPLLWTDGKKFYPSLVLEALRVVQGLDTYIVNASATGEDAIESIRVGAIEIPTSESGTFQIYYRDDDPALYLSASDIIKGDAREKLSPLIKDHIVFVGTSAVGLLDARTSALGESLPGVAVHAQALEQILSGQFLARPESIVAAELLLITLLGLATTVCTTLLRPSFNIVAVITGLLTIAGAAILAFRKFGLLFDFTFPVLALAAIFIATTAFKLIVTDHQGRQMRRMFGHYVSPSVLDEIERNPSALKLGGEIRDVSIMFVDIQNFTPLSEKLDAQNLVLIVNGVLEVCSTAILSQGGTIDKYIGDAVMAIWNAPTAMQDHQYHAALSAIKIRDALVAFNEDANVNAILQPAKIEPLRVRIGIASGPACVGNMGSLERFNYSALGGAVNTAARAENACKHIGHDIVIAGTLENRSVKLATLPAGTVKMKGKSERTPIHAVIGNEVTRTTHQFTDLEKAYTSILQTLTTKKSTKIPESLHQIMMELAAQNPEIAPLIEKLPTRRADFAIKLSRARQSAG
jgi:adenylate cyclase